MTRTTLLSALAHILHAPRDEANRLVDHEAVEQEVDGILCADMDPETDWEADREPDFAELFEAAGEARKEGEEWKGKGNRWFTLKSINGKLKVVPTKSKGGTDAPAGGNASSPDVPPGEVAPADKPAPASKRPNKATRLTPEAAEQQILAFQAKANVQPHDLKDLAETLSGMLDAGLTKEQLQTIARKHASKLTGKKQQLASALAQTALAAIKSGEASKPTDAVTTHLQAFQAVKQGQGDAKKFMAGVRKLKAADAKALAQKVSGGKVATKAMAVKVLSDAVGGAKEPEAEPAAEPKQEQPAEKPLTPESILSLASKIKPDASGYVPIWQLRQAAGSPEAFDATLKQMRRDGQVRLVAIGDRSRMTPEQLDQSIQGEGETLAYLEVEKPAEPSTSSPDVTTAPAEPIKPPATPKTDVAAIVTEIGHLWNNAPSVTYEQIDAGLKKLDGMSKAGLVKVADAVQLRGMAAQPPEKILAAIKHRVRAIKGMDDRSKMGDEGQWQNRTGKVKDSGPTEQAIRDAHEELVSSWNSLPGAKDNHVSLADIQDALSVNTATVHAVVHALRKKGILFAEPLEGGRGDNSRAIAAAIREDGQTLGWVGIRDGKEGEFKALAGGDKEPAQPPKETGDHISQAMSAMHSLERSLLDPLHTGESIAGAVSQATANLSAADTKSLAKQAGIQNLAGGKADLLKRITERLTNRRGAVHRSSSGPMGTGTATSRADPSDEKPATPDYKAIATPQERHDAFLQHEANVKAWAARQDINTQLRRQGFTGKDKLGRDWQAGQLKSHHGGKGLVVDVPSWHPSLKPAEQTEYTAPPKTVDTPGTPQPKKEGFTAKPNGSHATSPAEGLSIAKAAYDNALNPGTSQDDIRSTVARLGKLSALDLGEVARGFGITRMLRNKDGALQAIAQKILDRKGASERVQI